MERYHLNRKYNKELTPIIPEMVAGVKAYKSLMKKWEIVEIEKQVYNLRYKLAGHLDVLMKHRETGEYGILDWKTISDIFKRYNKMQEEMADWPDKQDKREHW